MVPSAVWNPMLLLPWVWVKGTSYWGELHNSTICKYSVVIRVSLTPRCCKFKGHLAEETCNLQWSTRHKRRAGLACLPYVHSHAISSPSLSLPLSCLVLFKRMHAKGGMYRRTFRERRPWWINPQEFESSSPCWFGGHGGQEITDLWPPLMQALLSSHPVHVLSTPPPACQGENEHCKQSL